MRKAGQMGTVKSRPRTKISQTATLKKTQSKRVRIQRKGRLPKEDKKTITAVAGMRPAGLSSTAKIVTDPRITKKLYQSNFPNLPPSSSELLKRTDFAVIKKPRKKRFLGRFDVHGLRKFFLPLLCLQLQHRDGLPHGSRLFPDAARPKNLFDP